MVDVERKVVLCRFCPARIFWARFAASDRRAPIDYDPRPDGNLIIIGEHPTEHVPLVSVLLKAEREAPQLFDTPEPRFVNHWATCPNPPEHLRKSKGAKTRAATHDSQHQH